MPLWVRHSVQSVMDLTDQVEPTHPIVMIVTPANSSASDADIGAQMSGRDCLVWDWVWSLAYC